MRKYIKCVVCNWRFGNIFHICIDPRKPLDVRPEYLPNHKKDTSRVMPERSDAHKAALSQAAKDRWARYRETLVKRDEKIVERYTDEHVSYHQLAMDFGVSYSTIAKVMKQAEKDGLVEIRPRHFTLARPGR